MATTGNFTKNSHKVGYAEAEILSRASESRPGGWVRVRCLNGRAHKRGDQNPSATYNLDTGYYQCHVCDMRGFANDRDRPDWKRQRQTRTYSNGSQVSRYRKRDGSKGFRQTVSNTEKSGERPKPYGYETIHSNVRRIYVVEGERCVDAWQEHIDCKTEAVVTSKQGSQSPHKTDWSPVKSAVANDCDIVFLPDRDEGGEKYVIAVARLLGLSQMQVVRLTPTNGKPPRGYDIADWVADQNNPSLPDPVVEPVSEPKIVSLSSVRNSPSEMQLPHIGDLFGIGESKSMEWLVENVLPANKVVTLIGRSGIGKSTMALYIAACLSRGDEVFGISATARLFPCRVLIYNSEDDWEDTVRPRLELMGADMERIGFLRSPTHPERSFNWQADDHIEWLHASLHENPCNLLIVDPIIDIIGSHNNNDPAIVRNAIEVLLDPIAAMGCAVLGVHHERKDAKKEDLLVDRAIGSQAWTAKSRGSLHMQALPKHLANQRDEVMKMDMQTNSDMYGIIVVSKSNIARVDGGWHYEIPIQAHKNLRGEWATVAVNPDKIKRTSPEELIQRYNPLAKEKIKSDQEKLATETLHEARTALEIGENAVRELFADRDEWKTDMLITEVQRMASIGQKSALKAIRNLTNPLWRKDVHKRKYVVRILKQKSN